MSRDPLSEKVIGCAIEVHRNLGPGLLETAYQRCLAYELERAEISCRFEQPMPINYKKIVLDVGYRIDVLVEDRLILELKAVEGIKGIHKAQALTHMKLGNFKAGL